MQHRRGRISIHRHIGAPMISKDDHFTKRKSPVYGRGGRTPICENHREMCMALRAKDFQKNSSDRQKPTIAGTNNLSTTRKVLGSIERGRCPFVEFMGVRYTSVRLAQRPSLLGRKVILSIHRNNLQTISAFLENGQFFALLKPSSPKWRVPHSYEFRKQVLKRCRQAYFPKEIL